MRSFYNLLGICTEKWNLKKKTLGLKEDIQEHIKLQQRNYKFCDINLF